MARFLDRKPLLGLRSPRTFQNLLDYMGPQCLPCRTLQSSWAIYSSRSVVQSGAHSVRYPAVTLQRRRLTRKLMHLKRLCQPNLWRGCRGNLQLVEETPSQGAAQLIGGRLSYLENQLTVVTSTTRSLTKDPNAMRDTGGKDGKCEPGQRTIGFPFLNGVSRIE